MSEVIDRPMLGHNRPPETPLPQTYLPETALLETALLETALTEAELTDFSTLTARLKPEILTGALEFQFGGHLTRRDALMRGVYRFAAAHCDPAFLTMAAVLPASGREGDIVCLKMEPEDTGTFHQYMMGRWRMLTDEQVIHLVLPRTRIADMAVSRKAVSFARQLKEAIRPLEHDRSAAKSVFDTAGKVVQGWFRGGLIAPLDAAAREIEAVLSAWQTRLDTMERAARLAESRRLQEEAATVAEAAARTEHPDILDAAVEAARAAERAETRAAASTADMARVRGALGGVAAAREVWTFTITDPSLVPREYLMVDEAKIRDLVRRDKTRAIGMIPGVEVKREIRTSVR